MRKELVCGWAALWVLAACSSDGGTPDGAPPPPIDAGVDADLFPDDQPIVGGSAGGVVDELGETLWFSFTSAGNEWIVAEVTFNQPVWYYHAVQVALYDARGAEFQTSPAAVPFETPRSLIAYVTEAGTYYVRVTDISSPDLEPFEPLSFTVTIRPPMPPSEYVDPETGDGVVDALALLPSPTSFLLGLEDHAGDMDPYSFDVADGERIRLLTLWGEPRRVSLIQSDGAVYARVDYDEYPDAQLETPPSLGSGSWVVRVEGPTAAPGAPYVSFLAVFSDLVPSYGQAEVEDPAMPGTNDDIGTAETLTMIPFFDDFGTEGRIGLPTGRLSAAADADVYRFPVAQPSAVLLTCAAGFYGSGARPLAIELLDDTGDLLASADEAHGGALLPWMSLSPGFYALRVHKIAQDPEIVGDYYKCAVEILPE